MVFHMKTTLLIPDLVFRDVKQRAAERGETISAVVTEFLRRGLEHNPRPKQPFRLPSFSAGPLLVDVANRDKLYDALDDDRPFRGASRKKG